MEKTLVAGRVAEYQNYVLNAMILMIHQSKKDGLADTIQLW